MPRQPLALAFILLLAGQQVQQISAVREAEADDLLSLDLSEEMGISSRDSSGLASSSRSSRAARLAHDLAHGKIPENDEGCTMSGMLFRGECIPKEYCMYRKVWGGLARDASCRLMPEYWSDVRTATTFGTHTGRLLSASQDFRKKGGWLAFHGLKEDLEKVSEAQAGMEKSEPEEKKISKECKEFYTTQSVSRYYAKLKAKRENKRNPLTDLELFDIYKFAGDGGDDIAVKRLSSNVQIGANKTAVLNGYFHKINFEKLQELQKGDKKPTKEELQEALPGVKPAELDQAMKQVQDKETAMIEKCQKEQPDDVEGCLLDAREAMEEEGLATLSEEAEEKKGLLLLQKLEAMGHNNIRVKDDPAATHASLLQFLDDNMEHLQTSEGEDYEEVRGIIAAVAVAIVGIFVIALVTSACGIAAGTCFVIMSMLVAVFTIIAYETV